LNHLTVPCSIRLFPVDLLNITPRFIPKKEVP
jgi:hypothetical protein